MIAPVLTAAQRADEAKVLAELLIPVRRAADQLPVDSPWRIACQKIGEEIAGDLGPHRLRLTGGKRR